MPVVTQKNGALNAAAAGFAGGFQHGVGVGQEQQKIDQEKQSQQFHQDQVLREAQTADQQLQMEQRGRNATGEAVQEMARPLPASGQGPFGQSSNPVAGPFLRGLNDAKAYGDTINRVGSIAKKMAENGVPLQHVAAFVNDAKDRHKKALDQEARKRLTDRIANFTSDGSGWPIQPDGTKIQDPGTDKANQQLSDSLEKGAPIEGVQQNFINLKNASKQAGERFRRKQGITTWLQGLTADVEQKAQATAGGPMSPEQVMALHQQQNDLAAHAESWDKFQDEIEQDPQGMRNFIQEVTDAHAGFTKVNGKRVPYAAAQYVADADAARAEAARANAELAKARAADVGPAAQDRAQNASSAAKNADAHMIEAGRPRGPASGTVSPSPSPEAQYKMAGDTVAARDPTAWAAMTVEQQNAERLKEMGRMRQAKQGFQSIDQAQAAGNTNAPTTQLDPNVLAQKAKAAHWTLEETKKFRDTGVAPAGKQPLQ